MYPSVLIAQKKRLVAAAFSVFLFLFHPFPVPPVRFTFLTAKALRSSRALWQILPAHLALSPLPFTLSPGHEHLHASKAKPQLFRDLFVLLSLCSQVDDFLFLLIRHFLSLHFLLLDLPIQMAGKGGFGRMKKAVPGSTAFIFFNSHSVALLRWLTPLSTEMQRDVYPPCSPLPCVMSTPVR